MTTDAPSSVSKVQVAWLLAPLPLQTSTHLSGSSASLSGAAAVRTLWEQPRRITARPLWTNSVRPQFELQLGRALNNMASIYQLLLFAMLWGDNSFCFTGQTRFFRLASGQVLEALHAGQLDGQRAILANSWPAENGIAFESCHREPHTGRWSHSEPSLNIAPSS